jgi:hypothetical protein
VVFVDEKLGARKSLRHDKAKQQELADKVLGQQLQDEENNSGHAARVVAVRPFPPDSCYVANEDETPRMIAKMFGLDLRSLIDLNSV